MQLLVDIGNTRIKWQLCRIIDALSETPIETAETPEQLQADWVELTRPKVVAIACVGQPELRRRIAAIAQRCWPGIECFVARTSEQACGVRNAYVDAAQLGVDRWLALLGARYLTVQPALVVDCGTAITLDVLAADGVHQGGLILPGLTMMKQALKRGAHQLDEHRQTGDLRLANNTAEGIANGVLFSAVAVIESMYRQLSEDNPHYRVMMTGGDAGYIGEHLSIPVQFAPAMVLQGLAMLLNE